MSKKRGSLLSYRPDIKVVDATLRDGGLVNDFRFTEDFVRDLYAANVAAGIDYMEFGYKASKDIFDPKDFGPWKFCEEADLRNIVGDNDTDMKIAVMADVGRCNYKRRYLTEEEKRALCSIAREVRPDFIKTSTGFGTGGATFEDVALMKKCVGDEVKIKAAGGIRTLDTALRMIELGVSRIGSTASVSIIEELKHRL